MEQGTPGERAYWAGANDLEAAAMDGELLEPRWRRLLREECDEEYIRLMRRMFEKEVTENYRSA